MCTNIYFVLIIFCIFSQGMLALEDDKNLSDHHLRSKRIIDKRRYSNPYVTIDQAPYVVSIQILEKSVCSGSILTAVTILTAAHCLYHPIGQEYSVLSGSHIKTQGTRHRILSARKHPEYRYSYHQHDIGLMFISPPIDLHHSLNRAVPLFNGIIPRDAYGTFSGWGCHRLIWGVEFYPTQLRSATLPIISPEECRHHHARYTDNSEIGSTDICTFDRSGKVGSCYGDSGAPLVFNGSLVGVLTGTKEIAKSDSPDVFINVAHPDHRNWIITHIQDPPPT